MADQQQRCVVFYILADGTRGSYKTDGTLTDAIRATCTELASDGESGFTITAARRDDIEPQPRVRYL